MVVRKVFTTIIHILMPAIVGGALGGLIGAGIAHLCDLSIWKGIEAGSAAGGSASFTSSYGLKVVQFILEKCRIIHEEIIPAISPLFAMIAGIVCAMFLTFHLGAAGDLPLFAVYPECVAGTLTGCLHRVNRELKRLDA